jgi:hypothetical protein
MVSRGDDSVSCRQTSEDEEEDKMITTEDMIDVQGDRRHPPGPEKEWNESYYFNFYDPELKIGMSSRIGLLVNRKQANIWFFLVRDNQVIHDGTNLDLPLPDPNADIDDLRVGNLCYQCTEPLRAFRLIYDGDDFGMDVVWRGFMPVFDFNISGIGVKRVAASHIEQAGEVDGSVTIKKDRIAVHGHGFRDHSYGERTWTAIKGHYLTAAAFGRDFAFSVSRAFLSDGRDRALGFLYDGEKMMATKSVEMSIETDKERTVQKGVQCRILDEEDRVHEVKGKVRAIYTVDLGRTYDHGAFARFEMDGRAGFGMIETTHHQGSPIP